MSELHPTEVLQHVNSAEDPSFLCFDVFCASTDHTVSWPFAFAIYQQPGTLNINTYEKCSPKGKQFSKTVKKKYMLQKSKLFFSSLGSKTNSYN